MHIKLYIDAISRARESNNDPGDWLHRLKYSKIENAHSKLTTFTITKVTRMLFHSRQYLS